MVSVPEGCLRWCELRDAAWVASGEEKGQGEAAPSASGQSGWLCQAEPAE